MLSLGNESTDALYGCDGEVRGVAGHAELYCYAVFLLFQILLSVFGNTLVCVAIIRFSHLQTLTNSFIFSLGVTDLLTPFVRVLSIAVSTLQLEWVFGCSWCQLSSVLGTFLCASSILHLCAISVERFIVIRWPLRQHRLITKKRVALALVNIWIMSLLCSFFPYFKIVKITFNAELLDCEIYWRENPVMVFFITVVFFFFPFLLMSITYYFIFLEVKMQKRKISALQIPQLDSPQKRRKSTVMSRLRITRIIREELKAVKVIVVVIGLFFVLWVPIFIVTSIRAYRPELVSGSVQRLAFATAYSNSSCNWIVYSVMNKELRKAFKKMLPRMFLWNSSQVEKVSRQCRAQSPEKNSISGLSRRMKNISSSQSNFPVRNFKEGSNVYTISNKEASLKEMRVERNTKGKSSEPNFLDLRDGSGDAVSLP